jgi:hypothetical protein
MARPSKSNPKGLQSSPKMTPEVLGMLDAAFSAGQSNVMACVHAGISEACLYLWFEKNPKLIERFNAYKLNPVMVARNTIYSNLHRPEVAWKFLERHDPDYKPPSVNDLPDLPPVPKLILTAPEQMKLASALRSPIKV